MKQHPISVIIPIYNSERTILHCLQSLKEQTIQPGEILLIDNLSTDRSKSIIETFIQENPSLNVKLLSENKKGPSATRNKGIKTAQSDILAFMDSDCLAPRNWVSKIQNVFLSDPDLSAIGGRVHSQKQDTISEKYVHVEREEFYQTITPLELNKTNILFKNYFLIFNNAAIHKKRFGNFYLSEDFTFGEDIDFNLMNFTNGKKIIAHSNEFVLYHYDREDYIGLLKQKYNYAFYYPQIIHKHLKNNFIICYKNKYFKFSSPLTGIINIHMLFKMSIPLLLVILFFIVNYILFLSLSVSILFLFYIKNAKHYKTYEVTMNTKEIFRIMLLSLTIKIISRAGYLLGSFKYKAIAI